MKDELEKLTPENFNDLPEEKKQALIEYNDEHVRQWRGTCQLCGAKLLGTRRKLKEHLCGKSSE